MLTIVKKNDTYDAIEYQITNDDGSVVNLTGATVKFVMGKKNKLITNADAVVTAANDGIVKYQLTSIDTLVPGTFLGEFVVTFANGRQKTFPSNGYITVTIEQNLDTTQNYVIVDMIAAKQGDFEKKLDDIMKLNNINVSFMNEYYWTATDNQITFKIPSGNTLDVNSNWVDVFVGGILVDKSLVDVSITNTITLKIDPTLIKAGMTVYAKWTDTIAPITYNTIDGGTF